MTCKYCDSEAKWRVRLKKEGEVVYEAEVCEDHRKVFWDKIKEKEEEWREFQQLRWTNSSFRLFVDFLGAAPENPYQYKPSEEPILEEPIH